MASLPSRTSERIPPLQNGDRLTRDEFERRYKATPHVKKAELIDGVVYMPSPIRHLQHGRPNSYMHGWLLQYAVATPGTEAGVNSSLRLDTRSEPQPDALLMISPDCGGQVEFDEDGYIVGAPELIAEIAASSVSYDRHAKLEAYRANAVQEYVIWRVEDRAIDWFVLHDERYEPMRPDADDLLKSRVFPGLWLDAQALLAGELAKVFQVVQQGTASAEHAEFVASLQARRR